MKNEKVLMILSASMMCLSIIVSAIIDIYYPDLFGFNIGNIAKSVIIYIVSVLITIFFFYCGISKNVDLKKKRTWIICSSILALFLNIISGVLGFVVAHQVNDKKKRELPKLELLNNHKKIVYIILFAICMVILFYFRDLVKNTYLQLLLYIVIMILTCSVFFKDLKRDFKYFKDYFKEYSSFVFKYYLIGMGTLFILNLSIRLTTGLTNSTNQIDLNNTLITEPFKMIFLACIYAPLCEEIMFRGCFRKIFNNKWLFIILSGLLFGAAHVLDDFQSLSELLYILSYSSIGFFLCYVYYKTNNIWCSIYYHFIQNAMSIIMMIIVSILK